MKPIHSLSGLAILLLAGSLLHAQSPDPAFAPPPLAPPSQEESPSQDQTPSYNVVPLSTGEDPLAGLESDCPPVPLYSSKFAFNFLLANFEMKAGSGIYMSTEPGLESRSEVAIERNDGYGIRFQSMSLEPKWDTDDGFIEIRMATFYLDGYRRIIGEHGELLLGGGLAYGGLKLDSPYEDSILRFNGLGGSLAGSGFFPLLRFEKTEFGVVGHARLAALAPLDDNFGSRDTMLVDELGIGLELRRRWGKNANKLWFVRAGREYQHWSDISSPFTVDQKIEATSFTVGLAW